MHYAVDVTGGGRCSAIIRKISREQIFRNRYLGHLERDAARMADNPRADLDQLHPQRRHRPVADRLRRRQRA